MAAADHYVTVEMLMVVHGEHADAKAIQDQALEHMSAWMEKKTWCGEPGCCPGCEPAEPYVMAGFGSSRIETEEQYELGLG